jgi:hypothetical protein
MVEPAGTRERDCRRGRGCGYGRVVSAVDVVLGRWGGAAALDEAAGMAEGSPLWSRPQGQGEGPPPRTRPWGWRRCLRH